MAFIILCKWKEKNGQISSKDVRIYLKSTTKKHYFISFNGLFPVPEKLISRQPPSSSYVSGKASQLLKSVF